MPRILLTGFTPFLGYDVNPTQRLVEAVAGGAIRLTGAAVAARLLRTDYRLSEVDFDAALADVRPDAIVAFGLAFSADEVRPERIAVNFDDGEEAGLPVARRIAADGPVGYWSTLPVDAMLAALAGAGLPVKASNHAGGFICNHIFYYARHRIEREQLGLPMGFVHVPPLPEQLGDAPERKGLAIERLLEAARVILAVVAERIGAPVAA
ncbi:MAG: pyrrolidone-carboxylate peptidase [Proteobacteria bacterium]|nr:pyrrolidone-carboxylate peptidase [Pseudomonadota bacterium]MBI3495909.1 pyrrolidone-carboxylate peptidase [Pseudomonadota bacterium]